MGMDAMGSVGVWLGVRSQVSFLVHLLSGKEMRRRLPVIADCVGVSFIRRQEAKRVRFREVSPSAAADTEPAVR